MDTDDEQELPRYIAERYCVLCRSKLHYFTYLSIVLKQFMSWEMSVLGFIDVSDESSSEPDVAAFRVDLDDPDFICKPSFTLHDGQGNRKVIDLLYNRPEEACRPAFFVHTQCWKVVRSLQPKLLMPGLYNLAMNLSQVLPKECWKPEDPSFLACFPECLFLGIVLSNRQPHGPRAVWRRC
ncbi:hypothetical protein Trco_003763 [Trichoderma cornu-damae]|uniref:Uncharacterized protein n=1 Tax=Trichoderma cornu-damae TaxID=654480 RepID=A0A9P8QL76_9HYPO|nr:hypothetical protein Trco_003763 [Trichoderma cornu-damae]